jgi:Sap, sulfolipid-1-addressing protein
MGAVIVLALSAAFNPTELAAATLMLLLPHPQRLLVGYWLGAMLTGTASGLVIVFALEGKAEHTVRHTVSPVVELVFAALLLIAAVALARGEDKRVQEHRRRRHPEKEKKTPKWQAMLSQGSARNAFVAGVLLSFPGVSYLAALDRIIHLQYSTAVTVLVIVGFNLVQNILLELPMLAFRIWPDRTPAAIDSAKAWISSHGRQYGARLLGFLGVALGLISVIGLVSR